MLKPWLLRLHRWTTIVFSVPLAVLIVTGLILSFEPIVQTTGLKPGTLSADRLVALIAEHDPANQARALSIRGYDNVLVLSGGRGPGTEIDLATGKKLEPGGSLLSGLFRESRRLHENFLWGLEEVVVPATIAMLVIAVLGIAMGWPRLRNTVSGWHKGMAWFGLPLVILSPLTGLMIAWGITFAAAPARETGARAAPLPLAEAVRAIGKTHDPSTIIWLRQRGGRQLARVVEGGEFAVHAVTADGLKPQPRNWPRLLHEGNFAGVWSGLFVVVTSLALVGLMTTGLIIWARRQLRRRNRIRPPAGVPAGA